MPETRNIAEIPTGERAGISFSLSVSMAYFRSLAPQRFAEPIAEILALESDPRSAALRSRVRQILSGIE